MRGWSRQVEPLRSTGDDGRRPIAESDFLPGDDLAERCLGLPEMCKKTKVVIFKPRTSKYAVARLRTSEYAVARLRAPFPQPRRAGPEEQPP